MVSHWFDQSATDSHHPRDFWLLSVSSVAEVVPRAASLYELRKARDPGPYILEGLTFALPNLDELPP